MSSKNKQTKILQFDNYDGRVYEELHQFNTAKKLLSQNRHHIEHLGHVIVKHGFHDKFGVCLLHKHFDLFKDERLVRTIKAQAKTVFIGPSNRSRDVVPYLWKTQLASKKTWSLSPLEYVVKGEGRDSTNIDFQKYSEFLSEFSEHLSELRLHNIFGIATMNILSIPCKEDELRVETTDSDKRLLTVKIESRGSVELEELTETFWTFLPNDIIEINGVLKCIGTHCKFHCKSHCVAHCQSHCTKHPPPKLGNRDVLINPGLKSLKTNKTRV
jgi:hypothetical protein